MINDSLKETKDTLTSGTGMTRHIVFVCLIEYNYNERPFIRLFVHSLSFLLPLLV